MFKASGVYLTNAHIRFDAEQDNPASVHHDLQLGSAHYTSPPLPPSHKSAWDSGALPSNTVTPHCVGSKFMRQLTDWQQLNIREYLWVQQRISAVVLDNEQWCWCCVKTLSGRNVTEIKVISFCEIKKAYSLALCGEGRFAFDWYGAVYSIMCSSRRRMVFNSAEVKTWWYD